MKVTIVAEIPGESTQECIAHLQANPYCLSGSQMYPGDMIATLRERLAQQERKLIEQECLAAGLRQLMDEAL